MGRCTVTKEVYQTREQRMADEYWKACEEYGSEEAVHICCELWGYSMYRTKQAIEKIEEDMWL